MLLFPDAYTFKMVFYGFIITGSGDKWAAKGVSEVFLRGNPGLGLAARNVLLGRHLAAHRARCQPVHAPEPSRAGFKQRVLGRSGGWRWPGGQVPPSPPPTTYHLPPTTSTAGAPCRQGADSAEAHIYPLLSLAKN